MTVSAASKSFMKTISNQLTVKFNFRIISDFSNVSFFIQASPRLLRGSTFQKVLPSSWSLDTVFFPISNGKGVFSSPNATAVFKTLCYFSNPLQDVFKS